MPNVRPLPLSTLRPAPLRPSLRRLSWSLPSAWFSSELVARCFLGAAFASLMACGPSFFAREAQDPQDLAAEELDDAGPDPELLPKGPAGQGCSPKGCLQDGPNERTDEAESDGEGKTEAEAEANAATTNSPLPSRMPIAHPLLGKGNAEIERMVQSDLASLGSMSFGTATRGGLINAVFLPNDSRWVSVDPSHAWGTEETIDYLVTAIDAVHAEFPDSHPLFIGDLSRQRGGYLQPHLSHQSGKDVDVSYFYTRDPKWYARATASNLDRQRSWAIIRAIISRTDVQYIFIDRRVQRLLRSYAEAIGEDREWLESVFDGIPGEPAIIRHEPGHDTHFHVRFFNPVAEETARRCYTALVQHKKLLPMRYNVTHKAKRGDTLTGIAKKYGTTVAALMRANNMRKSTIQADKTYLIPRNGGAVPAAPLQVPPRRVPPPARPPTGSFAGVAPRPPS
jgi:murein endopeptidase